MHNFKLTVAYDGTDFHGWQLQPGQPTVQGVLTEIAQQLTQENLKLHAAGRTDAGVHAWGQVVSFRTGAELTAGELEHGFNALLPDSIRVRAIEEVAPDFHARWAAQAKTYEYRISHARVVSPFRRRYVMHAPYPLDFAAMNEAARCFEGEHDFTSFAASSGSEDDDRDRNVMRSIYTSELRPASGASPLFGPATADCGDEWVYIVRGKSFLRHMVRKIAGTLLEIGRGRLTVADVQRIIELHDRGASGPTLPACGLCLVSVEYPDPTSSIPKKNNLAAEGSG